MPAAEARKEELALAYGRDGRTLLKAVYAAAASDPDLAFLARLQQVEVLRVVLLQNYLTVEDERGREVIKRREAQVEGLPPGRSRITSPYDTDARQGVKRDTFWNGYKVHVTETCDTAGAVGQGGSDDAGAGCGCGDHAAASDRERGDHRRDRARQPDDRARSTPTWTSGACCPASIWWTRATPRRSCWCPPRPATGSRWSPPCWPTPHRRPGRARGSTAPRSPSTSTPGTPPARKAAPAAHGIR